MAGDSVRHHSRSAIGRATTSAANSAQPFHQLAPSRSRTLTCADDEPVLARRPQVVAVYPHLRRSCRSGRTAITLVALASRRPLRACCRHVRGPELSATADPQGWAPRRLANARDVGVSYFVFGVAGTLTGYLRSPWRSRCQLGAVAALTANAVVRPTFTEVGHLTALIVGLTVTPLAPDRDGRPYPSDDVYSTVTDLARLRGLSTS